MNRSEAAQNIREMRRFRREVTASPEAARQALKEAGIMTEDGHIADPYKPLFKRQPTGCTEEVQV
jgi:hypothetical protein